MKRNRLVAQILMTVFLASIPGITGAAITPDPQAEYAMAGENMTIDTGGAQFTLKKGQVMKISHGGKTWTLTANEDTAGYVQVSGDTLDFTYDTAQLVLVAPAAGAAFGGTTAAVAGGTAAAAGGAAALTGGHGGTTPQISPH